MDGGRLPRHGCPAARLNNNSKPQLSKPPSALQQLVHGALSASSIMPPPKSWKDGFSALEAMYEKHFKGGESPSIGCREPILSPPAV